MAVCSSYPTMGIIREIIGEGLQGLGVIFGFLLLFFAVVLFF